MKCFSMQKLRRRHNGAEQAGSFEESARADADEVSSPPTASASSTGCSSFRSRVRAIQNAQKFINSNPKLRSSHPSYGSRESKKDAPDVSRPLLTLGGRARSATELGSGLFDVGAAYRSSKHVEATCARLPSAQATHLVDKTCTNTPFLQPLPSSLQVSQKAPQQSSAYRLPLPSENAHLTPPHPVLPAYNSCSKSNLTDTICMHTAVLLPETLKHSVLQSKHRENSIDVVSLIPIRDVIVHANCSIPKLQPLPPPNRDTQGTSLLRCFKYDELLSACQNFALDCRITDADVCFNGTIKVKGNWKASGHQDVVVLLLKEPYQQGLHEWMSKLSIVAHELPPPVHVCRLIGFYGEDDGCAERMLVYERLKKGTLFSLLFESSDIPPLEWSARMKIAYGAAQGLATLHEKFPNTLLYKDFRASSIQVDQDYSSKVSLYGIVNPRNDQTSSSNPRENAYRAPETVSRDELTLKSNVWSFGVILLELLCGKQHLDEGTTKTERLNLVKWAKPFLLDEGKLFLLMDPKLQGKFPSRGAKMVADLALVCLRRDPTKRPSMKEALDVVRDVYESKYMMTRCSAREPIAISEVTSSSSTASRPISGPFCGKPSSTNQQRPSLYKTPSKFEVVENPPLRPLIIPPRCGGEGFAHRQHEYSPAPLAHINF